MELREKTQKRWTAAERAAAGDMGDHTAIAADSQRIVSLVVGKRTHEQTRALVHATKQRLHPGHLPALCTDAYDGSEAAILAAFGRRSLVPDPSLPGRSRRSVLRSPQGLAYGQVKKQSKGRGIERVDVRGVHGKARLKHVLSL
jgi:hypothetical protein